jgi:hypothetical protein
VMLYVHMPKTMHSGRMFGRETAHNATEFRLACPNRKFCLKYIRITPRLARNTPFAHLDAPRACQSVVLSVHMAKTIHFCVPV